MTHADFVDAYRDGRLRLDIDRKAAARFMSARLLLPFVMLPVLGLGTALALTGWLWMGLSIIGLATLAPMLIKRSAPHFVMTQALEDEQFYSDAVAAAVLQMSEVPDDDVRHSRESGNPF